MAKVLITGVAGLLGANFSRYLLSKGHQLIGIDDLSGGYKENIPDDCHFYEINLLDEGKVNEIFEKEKPDYVYHFAAYAAVCLSPFIRNHNYQNNLVCSANIINACIKNDVKKLIFSSSMDVYGELIPPFTEDMQPIPADPYGISKYAVELDLKSAAEQFNLKYTIVRPHNIAGIYQNIWDRYRNVIGIWMRKVLNKEPITIYGDGEQIRSFSDVKFYMKPFEKLMEGYDSEIFNIGADYYCSINELADTFTQVVNEFGYDVSKVYLERRHEVQEAYCDHAKAKNMLGFHDETNLATLMHEMFEWAQAQPVRPVKFMEYEIDKGIYSYWQKDKNV